MPNLVGGATKRASDDQPQLTAHPNDFGEEDPSVDQIQWLNGGNGTSVHASACLECSGLKLAGFFPTEIADRSFSSPGAVRLADTR
jgi:hypothetical protein